MSEAGTLEKRLSLREVHVFNERGRDFLLAVGNCAFWNVDAPAATMVGQLMRERRKADGWTRGELQDRFGNEYGADQVGEIFDELAGVGLFYEDDGAGDPAPDRFPRASLQVGSLVCHVAHDCNLKCAYCYGDGGSYGGQEELMSEAMALDYVEMLFANSGQLDSVHMTFFGGEPLMNMPVIKAAVARGEELSKETGKKITFSVTTNGTLVTPEIARYLDDHRIGVSISLDGAKDVNDAVRVFRDSDESSYEAVRKVMGMFQKGRPLGTRVTLTRKSLDVSGAVDHLLKMGFFEVGVTPVNCGNPELDFDKHDLEKFHAECVAIGERYLEAALAGGYYGFSNISNVLRQLHTGEDKAYPCGAGIQLYAGDPQGNLFMCHRLVGNEKYQVGDVGQGIDHDRQAEFLHTVNLENKEGCSGCWARYICSGGCYYISELHYEDPSRTHHMYCRFLRKWYEYGIGLYAEIMERCPEFITKVLEPRIVC